MDCEAHNDAEISLPPERVKAVVQKCFSDANQKLAAFRARKIRHGIKTARLQAERQLRSNINGYSHSENKGTLGRHAGSISKSIFAIPNHSKERATLKSVSQCPGGLSWIRVRSNMRAADQGKDSFFVPYIGESEKHLNFSNKLAADTFEVDERVPDDISEDEGGEDEEESHGTIKEDNQSAKNAKNAGSTSLSSTEEKKKLSERVWARAAMRVALKCIFEELGCASLQPIAPVVCNVFGIDSTAKVAKCLKNITYRQKKYEEADQEEKVKKSYRTEMIQILDGSVKSTPSEILKGDSIPFFVCRQCYAYNCFLHGNYTAKPSNAIPDKTRKDSSNRQISKAIEFSCEYKTEKKCWHIDESLPECRSWWRDVKLEEGKAADIRAVILELYSTFGADPCRIASSCKSLLTSFYDELQLTCCRVGYLFTEVEGIRPVESTQKQKNRRRVRKSPYSIESYKTKRKKMRMEDENGLKGGLRRDFEPCKHSGPCTAKSCPCVLNGVNCEKYCSCNHTRSHEDRAERRLTCMNAFKGCTCKSAVACVSNACICYSWKRECDPDICRACHECKEDRDEKSCGNDGLLMGKRKRIVVGHSDTHGWGAFAAAPISKNEFIGEYVGEIVDQEHADRRGRLYDEVQYSFLFNITDDFALDSTRVGNKLRFCNHAFAPNCEARLMRVAGDIRVGLYAKRDIAKHEELFFDYKYKFGPDWAVPTEDKKLTRSFKEKRSSAPIAKKQASSNQHEQCVATPITNGKRPANDDPDFHKKIKRARTMCTSTRSQAKNQKTPIPRSPPMKATSSIMNCEKSGNVDEQQSKPTDGHPVKRPLSVWRGVLRRVVTRATESGTIDQGGPSQQLSSAPANLTKAPSVEEEQLPVDRGSKKFLQQRANETEPRSPRRGDSEGPVQVLLAQSEKDYLSANRGRSSKPRSLYSSHINETDSPSTSPVLRAGEARRKVGSSSSPKINSHANQRTKQVSVSQGLRTQRLIMSRRLKEIFGSDDETDDNESEADMGQSRAKSSRTEGESTSRLPVGRSRKRHNVGLEDVEDAVPTKRQKSAPGCRKERVSLGHSPRIAHENGDVKNGSLSFTENQSAHNQREATTLDSERISKAIEKVNDNVNRRGRTKRQPSAQRPDRSSRNSSRVLLRKQNENPTDTSGSRAKKNQRLDPDRSGILPKQNDNLADTSGSRAKKSLRLDPHRSSLLRKQNDNPADTSRSLAKRSLRLDPDRSGSGMQRSKRVKGDSSRGRAHLAYSHQFQREREQEPEAITKPQQEPELQVPMVNLISDEESDGSSGSFDPKFF